MAKGISVPVVQSGLETSIQQGVKNVGKINIPATIDPSAFKNLAQPLGRVSGLATEFEKSIAASNARVLAFGASVGIINGVQNAFADLVKTGIEVQKTLADIAAISGQGGKQLSQFGDALFDVGKQTGQSFKTAAQAALEFSRQGLSVEETLKRTTDALTLTRFTSLNAAEAVDVLTAAANSFGESGITTAQIINKLVAVDTKFAVSAEDLANGLARAGSIAQEVGVNFDELNAAITVAQERTARGGAVIGNALKTIFTRLRSDETVQALRDIGVESLNAQGQLKGAVPLLQEVAQKIKGLSGGERVQILEAVASKYNINILSALLDDLNNANSKFTQAVGVSAGASNQAYERQIELNKTLAAQINAATVSVTQLFNKLSEIGVTDSLSTLLKFVSDLINGFNKLIDSETVGGNIAKGLVKGISDVFFTIGLPIIGAIFIKLTKDVAQFGVESLKTILGINQQVRERQALEQAVVNTLIRDQEIMATILSLSGNRAKQEEYLLGVYNRQVAALQQVQTIAQSVAPALMAGGLSATSGQIKKRGAGGYLPAQEAADVRRGVGGASPSSRVVSIPNFAFGGGKRGTMIANTSEYIVPNFANGGSAIFNRDMARTYGLPAGAKKISAAGGYIPNFARYVYDADRIEPDKNALLKAILASGAKKNLIVGPAGSGKSTYGASLGSFITNAGQLIDATEIDILSGAARTKDGGVSKNFQQIADAVNASGGKISYLYAGNMDILSRRSGRIGAGPAEGDLRSQKQIAGSMYAPLNQFDFISQVKGKAKNFEMIRGAKGYIPNFAEQQPTTYYTAKPEWVGQLASAGLPSSYSSKKRGSTKADIDTFLNSRGLILSDVFSSEKVAGGKIEGASSAFTIANATAAMLLPNAAQAAEANRLGNLGVAPSKEFLKTANLVKFSAFGLQSSSAIGQQEVPDIEGKIKKAILSEAFSIVNQFTPIKGKEPFSANEFEQFFLKKGGAAGAVAAAAGATFESAVDYAFNPLQAESGPKGGNTLDVQSLSPTLRKAFGGIPDGISKADYKISAGQVKKFANQVLANKSYNLAGAAGYIPNFAAGSPLGDAINREMAAGVSPNKIRVTQDGRLRNSGNPGGLAVINTRDEPNGKIPNFASNDPRNIRRREDTAVRSGRASYITDRPTTTDQNTKEFEATTGKLMATFVGLQMATSTLQSTFQNTESSVGKFAASLSQIATTAAGYSSLGSLTGDALKGKFGKFGEAAGKYGGLAGAIIGTGISSYQMLQEASQGPAREAEKSRKENFNRILQADLASAPDDKQRLVDLQSKLSAAKKMQQGLMETESSLKVKVGRSGRLVSTSESEAVGKRVAVKTEEIRAIEQEIQNIQSRQTDALSQQSNEYTKRIGLATQIYKIEEAFAKRQATKITERAQEQAKLIADARNYNEAQKVEAELKQKLTEFDRKIADAEDDTLQSALVKLKSSSALVTVKNEELQNLIDRVAKTQTLQGLDEEINKLGVEGAMQAREILKALASQLTQTREKNKAERDGFEIVDRQRILTESLIKADKIRLSIIQDTTTAERKLADIRTQGARSIEDLTSQTGIITLQNQISRQPFATRSQEASLARLNAELAKQNEIKSINRNFDDTIRSSERDKQDAYSKTASELNMLTDAQQEQLQELIKTKNFSGATNFIKSLTLMDPGQGANWDRAMLAINNADQQHSEQLKTQNKLKQIALTQLKEQQTYELAIINLREKSPMQAGAVRAITEIEKEVYNFQETFAYNTTNAFRDGLRDAMGAAISQTDDLGAALQNVAMNFLKTMQSQFLNQAAGNITVAIGKGLGIGMAKGGLVSGGSGYRDDVPAMLTGGEFVMRKSAVQKYGAANLAKMNSGGIFLPGVRGGGAISGYDALRAFAGQTTTSGATDVLRGGGSSAFINLEDQSSRLSRYALLNDDTINQEIRSAQEQGLNIIAQREAYRTQQRKAFQQQLVGTIASAALNYGVGKLASRVPYSATRAGMEAAGAPTALAVRSGLAYGGMIRRYASGGPTDDIPALLMSGEYVMNRGATSKYGKRMLDAMNQGRASRFADGGEVGASTTTTESNAKMMGDVSININVSGQSSQTETQGNTNQGGIDYKKMSERIKAVVIETINEEKRLGGSLRSR